MWVTVGVPQNTQIRERFLVHATPGHTVRQTNQSRPHFQEGSTNVKRWAYAPDIWSLSSSLSVYALEGHCESQPVLA